MDQRMFPVPPIIIPADRSAATIADKPTWSQSLSSALLSQRTWQVLVWAWHQTAKGEEKKKKIVSKRFLGRNRNKQSLDLCSGAFAQFCAKTLRREETQSQTVRASSYLAAAGQQCWDQ
jgi:hypothetical protein